MESASPSYPYEFLDLSDIHDENEVVWLRKLLNNNEKLHLPWSTGKLPTTEVTNGIEPGASNHTTTTHKSFASLFHKGPNSNSNHSPTVNNSPKPINSNVDNNTKPVEANEEFGVNQTFLADPIAYRMGEFLMGYSIDCKTTNLQPRGLINRSNYCYINSILQVLLSCPPLYNLLTELKRLNRTDKTPSTPVLDGLCKFIGHFVAQPQKVRHNQQRNTDKSDDNNQKLNCDQAFEPNWFYKILNESTKELFQKDGKQQDAEEFFGYLLNEFNDEMVDVMKLPQNNNSLPVGLMNGEDEDDWKIMGPKNKGSITRKTLQIQTPVTEIFGGSLKSRIYRVGDECTNNIQPFLTLQLNIERVATVHEALEALLTKTKLEGVVSPTTNEPVEAWQQVTLEKLPIILVLHLKCFDFQLDGCRKIVKALQFPINLKIDSKLLSTKPVNVKERQYKLFAVVYHDGKEASNGHYVTDAFHSGYTQWIRHDDASLKIVSEDHVLHPHGNRVPYLLFYRRCDTFRTTTK